MRFTRHGLALHPRLPLLMQSGNARGSSKLELFTWDVNGRRLRPKYSPIRLRHSTFK